MTLLSCSILHPGVSRTPMQVQLHHNTQTHDSEVFIDFRVDTEFINVGPRPLAWLTTVTHVTIPSGPGP